MTDPRDGQPHDELGSAGPPPTTPPTTPPSASGYDPLYPPGGGSRPNRQFAPDAGPGAPFAPDAEPEYVVHSGPHPVPPTSFQNAPDPFGEATGNSAVPPPVTEKQKGGAKRWIIPIASLVVLVVVAAAAYFLFFQSDDSDQRAEDPPASEQAESDREDGESSESGSSESGSSAPGSTESGGAAAEVEIAGTFQVNGTIESYTGPPTGQLGGIPKTPGSPAFTSPQTWTIDDCTDTTCELTVQQGGMTVTLELADGTWSGETTQKIACTPTAGAMIDAMVEIEIPAGGGTATRTFTAQCDEPIEEVDALTLSTQ